MTIQISDVDKLETELEKIKEQHGQMVVQISGMDDRIYDIEQWKVNHSPAPTSPFTDDNNPATPQPVRIRPDDMVMVKWFDENKPRAMRFGGVNFNNPQLEYISPIQPVKAGREWNERMLVWRAREENAGDGVWEIKKVFMTYVEAGDLWQPILSPDEPAPEGPEVG